MNRKIYEEYEEKFQNHLHLAAKMSARLVKK
jgi:hypothetical protein